MQVEPRSSSRHANKTYSLIDVHDISAIYNTTTNKMSQAQLQSLPSFVIKTLSGNIHEFQILICLVWNMVHIDGSHE